MYTYIGVHLYIYIYIYVYIIAYLHSACVCVCVCARCLNQCFLPSLYIYIYIYLARGIHKFMTQTHPSMPSGGPGGFPDAGPSIPLTFRRRGVEGPQFHESSLPHERKNGTANGDLQGSPPPPINHF